MSNFYTGGGSGTSNRLIGVSDFLIEVAKGTVLGHLKSPKKPILKQG
jgi:hypothetical protein